MLGHTEKHQKAVLLIDDDASIREILQYTLESEGYKVTTAENGKIGLEMLHHEPTPCIVILDMLMPIMTGRQFLDEISKIETLNEIPIIVVSATADHNEAAGAKKLITKPAELSVLLNAIAEFSNCSTLGLRTHLDASDFERVKKLKLGY